jgi:hypothetical protein
MNVKEEAVDFVLEFIDKFHDQSRPRTQKKKRRRKTQEEEEEWNE